MGGGVHAWSSPPVIYLYMYMNLDGFFDLVSGDTPKTEESVLDIYNHPLFKIRLFIHGVLKISSKTKIVLLNMINDKVVSPDGSIEALDKVKKMLFFKAFEFLEEVNFENTKDILKDYITPEFGKALDICMTYFVDMEEYEKCAVLKKFQGLFEESLEV